ncbi:NADH-quinone oxidoreductase subunit J [Rhodococcus spelaei]|uniref:NADH-quinone oxidoreductase subunit J n=1 Tax=Rhodococcus spelaei TaxID=2546320 RepID=A0A541B7G5_9NOCA|nr:NADH-quinone oxidoreductase subunit J [Rhodococcus spelaei]TQF68254.1 NADH-quinone oxidoreductase subunit J [Rhodococcus spelaei]
MNPNGATVVLAETFTRTSTAEGVQFWILATLAVVGALGVVSATKAVYSAIFLATTMIILAVFYIAQGAVFLGVVQVVVYTGAVMMLFLFVLMLVGVDSSESLVETIRGQRVAAIVVGIGFGTLLIAGLGNALAAAAEGGRGFVGADRANAAGNVPALADLIFVRYVWAFELTGALLITATIGAMVLAHRERFEPRRTQREMSEDRFRGGGLAAPLPSPGVYARHNAVHLPALLPDGTPAQSSVSAVLQRRRARDEATTAAHESSDTPTEHGSDEHGEDGTR